MYHIIKIFDIFYYLEIKNEADQDAMTQQLMMTSALNAMGLPSINGTTHGKSTPTSGAGSVENPAGMFPFGMSAGALGAGALGMYPGIGVPPPLLQSGVGPGELR